MSEQELDRQVRHRLAVLRHAEEVTGNVAMTSRYFGISRQTFYKWQQRYQADGEEGLRPRSRRPHTCPHATQVEVVGKILYLRQHYHFGLEKIAMYLVCAPVPDRSPRRPGSTSRSAPRCTGTPPRCEGLDRHRP